MKKFSLVTVLIVAFIGITSQGFAAGAIVRLGEALYKDLNLSRSGDQSCVTCHHPLAGFADTSNHVDPINSPVSDGSAPINPSDLFAFGGRNAPSAAYAGFSPALSCVPEPGGGLFCTGGMFWDGRATGQAITDTGGIVVDGVATGPTFDPLADQAKGPFQNPVEMNLIPEEVIEIVVQAKYARLFQRAFGYRVAKFASAHPEIVYNDIGIAITAFERSRELNKFNSKFDRFAREQADKGIDVSTIAIDNFGVIVDGLGTLVKSKVYMAEELEGLALFNMPTKGNCAACHPSGPITDPTDSQGKTLFTDFSYDNLGDPVNPLIVPILQDRRKLIWGSMAP